MGRISVKAHTRRRPRRSNRSSGNEFLFKIVAIGVLLIFLIYLFRSIPTWVYVFIFALAVTFIVLFASIRIYQVRHQRRQEIENREYQEGMRQIQFQERQSQQQQVMAHQSYMQQIHLQVQAQQERERLARIKTLGDMLTLSPPEFEEFVGKLLESSGCHDIQQVGKSGDLGADLLARDAQGNLVIVQCKKYSTGKNIGTPELQKFVGAMVHYKAQKGIFVTTSTFTKPAEEYVKDKPMLHLMDGRKLINWVHNTAMLQ